jgi:hypothetical protein
MGSGAVQGYRGAGVLVRHRNRTMVQDYIRPGLVQGYRVIEVLQGCRST